MTWLPKIHLGVIDDARKRQRRRWLVSSAAAVAAVVAVGFALDQPSADRSAPPVRAAQLVPPSKVLSREPYMGVACSIPNSTRCDRIGLAVWLKRPAVGVRAKIDGRYVSLQREQWASKSAAPYSGYLRQFGLKRSYHVPVHWLGARPPVHPAVRLRIDYGRGRIVRTRLRVWLMAGWG
jgi:hypothetical protein